MGDTRPEIIGDDSVTKKEETLSKTHLPNKPGKFS